LLRERRLGDGCSTRERAITWAVPWIHAHDIISRVVVSRLIAADNRDWTRFATPPGAGHEAVLEAGDVLFLPNLAFEMTAADLQLCSPVLVSAAKNVSFDPKNDRLGGTSLGGDDLARLRNLLSRFSTAAAAVVRHLVPSYAGRLAVGRASFRPVEIAGRSSSWRKDDTRLHIDSFPATPVHGHRILRLFTNVNPHGRPRSWRIGEDFESVAARFAPLLRVPWPGSAALLRLLHLTRSRRSAYDALMLQLHDRMKADARYQAEAPQASIDFVPGVTWIAFTDQLSHAAMAGQYQLEQTLLLPVDAMLDQERSPLRILERLLGRRLA
jgi:hypothetical protein